MVATDSYRLAVKDTKLEAPLARAFEANVPARALQELTRIVQHGNAEPIAVVAALQPGRVRGRRRRALLAPDRRPVPERPPAAARGLRARAAAQRRRDHRRRAPHLAAGAEERAAAAELRRGRADGVGADAGRRRGARDRAGAVPGRAVRDRLQPGVPARRPRGARVAATCVLKLISPLRPGLIEAADGSGFLYLLMPIRLNV